MGKIVDYIAEKEKMLGNPLDKEKIKKLLDDIGHKAILAIQLAEVKRGHDPYKHGDQISKYVEKIARDLDICEEEIKVIAYAASLHDIGKLMVNKKILLKPGKLTAPEYEEMKKHSIYGEKLLLPLSYIAKLVRHHHERWDGKGYPDGLKGEQIPLGSRIISVIDVFNAITHERTYKKAMTKKYAIEEIEKNSGTQFDPQIVALFVKHFK